MPYTSRNALIAGGVVLLHAAALWALQTGLGRRDAETVVPVELLTAVLVTPPAVPSPPAPAPQPPQPAPPVVRKVAPAPAPRPLPSPKPAPAIAPAQPSVSSDTPAAPPVTAPAAPAPAPVAAAPAPASPAPKVELPTSNADYLNNPPPQYPRASFRLGEEGTTVVRVLIGPDGRAQDAQVARSSGFTRLDQAAEQTARNWRYVPGKRGGVPEAMWVNVPIKWEIKKE